MKAQEQLGMRIRFLRSQRRWSQEDLSLEAGINKNYISDLENGRRNPSLDVLERLCVAFGITLENLSNLARRLPLQAC